MDGDDGAFLKRVGVIPNDLDHMLSDVFGHHVLLISSSILMRL